MPIHRDLRPLYPPDWAELSAYVRRERARDRCEACGLAVDGLPSPWTGALVVLSVAHLDHDPTNSHPNNLRALCQRCHNLHDLEHRLATRRARRRCPWTLDLFGAVPTAAAASCSAGGSARLPAAA